MQRLSTGAEAYALLVLTALAALFFSIYSNTSAVFATAANLQAISGSQAVLIMASLALLLPLVCNEYDLSVGANLGLSAILTAKMMADGQSLVVAVAVGVVSGAVVGLFNGLVVTRAKVPAVVMTLGTTVIVQGLIQQITSGNSISTGISATLLNLGSNTFLQIPTVLIAALVVTALVGYLLGFTPLGRRFYMLGDNRLAASLVGLKTDRLLLLSFVLGGVVAGLGGVLLVSRSGSATPDAGNQYLLPAFAAAFLSAAAIKPGKYNVGGMLTAIAFLAVLNGGLNLAGALPYMNDYVNGTALLFGVALAAFLGRRRVSGGASRRRIRLALRRTNPEEAGPSASGRQA